MPGDVYVCHFAEGTRIFSEGDEGDGMYVVLSGRVRVFKTRDGHETTLAILNHGEFFGEMSLFDHRPRSASVEAVSPTELRWISPAEFDLLTTDPFVKQMLKKMSERLRAVDEALDKLEATNSVRQDYVAQLHLRRDWAV